MTRDIAGDHWLDSLTKSLAEDLSRKAFLRLLGAAAFTLFVPAPVRAARAQLRRCSAGCTDDTFPDCCNGVCTNVTFDAGNCQACGQRCGAGEICREGACIKPSTPPPFVCDPPCASGELCRYSLDQRRDICCRPEFVCGNVCYDTLPVRCPMDICCRPGQTCCRTHCCDPGEICLADDGGSGDPCCRTPCNGVCCGEQGECINGSCWPKCDCAAGQRCIDTGGFSYFGGSAVDPAACCPGEQLWDTGPSYSSGRMTRGTCCAADLRWTRSLPNGEAYICCPTQDRWDAEGVCCPPQDRWSRTNYGLCCPPQDRWDARGLCCPPADRWDGPGLCCPPERRCSRNGMDICCEANESCTDNNLCEACRSFDLNGMWEDNGREIQIIHEGHHVTATYVEPHTCDHRNGSGTSQTTLDFTADIRCNTLIGEMNVCHWGDRPNPGFRLTPLRLTASPEGKSVFAAINRLMGEWKNEEGSGLLSIRRLE